MDFHLLTLFPAFFASPLSTTMLQKGQDRGAIRFHVVDIRDFATDKHKVTDDTPYGGGAGMVMKPDPIVAALESLDGRPRRILLTPRGARFDQASAARLAGYPSLALVCGRYEGVDERVLGFIDEELSVGDVVLSGGEIAALTVVDAVSRLVPGVLGDQESAVHESFSDGLLEYPQYTRPAEFRGVPIPEILRSGDHGAIARWRRRESLRRTWTCRPELLASASLDDEDRAFLTLLADKEPHD